jgi:hypothetical protein
MASSNILSVCNRALYSIGSRAQISNLDEGTPEADGCSLLFQSCYEQLARKIDWNCLRKQAKPNLIAAAKGTPENLTGDILPVPPVPFLYQYLLPTDCLMVRFIISSKDHIKDNLHLGSAYNINYDTFYQNASVDYVISYAEDSQGNPLKVILTHLTKAELIYTVNSPNPETWDSLFDQAMVASLAAQLCPGLNMNIQLMNGLNNMADKFILEASVRDGNEQDTLQSKQAEWIIARNGNGRYHANNIADSEW